MYRAINIKSIDSLIWLLNNIEHVHMHKHIYQATANIWGTMNLEIEGLICNFRVRWRIELGNLCTDQPKIGNKT